MLTSPWISLGWELKESVLRLCPLCQSNRESTWSLNFSLKFHWKSLLNVLFKGLLPALCLGVRGLHRVLSKGNHFVQSFPYFSSQAYSSSPVDAEQWRQGFVRRLSSATWGLWFSLLSCLSLCSLRCVSSDSFKILIHWQFLPYFCITIINIIVLVT